MANSKNINATQGKLKQSLGFFVDGVIDNRGYEDKITKAANEAKVRTGVVTKFYHYLDKAEVKLDFNDKKVLCKVLHRFGGELTEYFTPVADRVTFCDKRKEPCVIPRSELHCLVVSINDEDSSEWLLLGFYSNEELVGINPASPGNIKLTTREAVNQYWVKFGFDGLDLRLPEKEKVNIGEYNRDMEEKIPMDTSMGYTKDEIDNKVNYLQEEIDNIDPSGDMSKYIKKDEFLDLFDVDFNYSWGNPLLNEDRITIDVFLKEKNNGDS